MKTCGHCKETGKRHYRKYSQADGLDPLCADCRKESTRRSKHRSAEAYEQLKAKQREYARTHYYPNVMKYREAGLEPPARRSFDAN